MTPEQREEEVLRLLELRKSVKKRSNPREYNRIRCRLYWLRHTEAHNRRMGRWLEKHRERLRYERILKPKKKKIQKRSLRVESVNGVARRRIDKAFIKWVKRSPEKRRNKESVFLLAGCTRSEFQEHIELQLKKLGWTWEDWQIKWTFDHVIPVRNFHLPVEKRSCWHYTNIRPCAKLRNTPLHWSYGRRQHCHICLKTLL